MPPFCPLEAPRLSALPVRNSPLTKVLSVQISLEYRLTVPSPLMG